jgi:hypothetical protein
MRMSAALFLSRLIRNADNSPIGTLHPDVACGMVFPVFCDFVPLKNHLLILSISSIF